jgi:phosphomannomutase
MTQTDKREDKKDKVIKITASHWKTFLLGIKVGKILGFKLLTIQKK